MKQLIVSRREALRAGAGVAGMLALAACGQAADEAPADEAPAETDATPEADTAEAPTVRVASLKGPTSIGLVAFMDAAKQGNTAATYEFTISTAADEIVPAVVKGDVDIALLPANAASVLYNKTEGAVCAIDINTLGVLNVVTGDESVQALTDLAGRTVYMTGKGAVPEYTMQFLLGQAGIADAVTLEFKDEPTEVVAALSADPSAVGVLPQPFATVATTKNESLAVALDLTEVWDATVTDGSQLLTGVTVARKEFVEAQPEALAEFLEGQQESVQAANDDPAAVAPLVVEAGIIDSEGIAAKAIPSCHLVCITGDEMRQALEGYLQAIYGTDPSAVGGALPGDDFYYEG